MSDIRAAQKWSKKKIEIISKNKSDINLAFPRWWKWNISNEFLIIEYVKYFSKARFIFGFIFVKWQEVERDRPSLTQEFLWNPFKYLKDAATLKAFVSRLSHDLLYCWQEMNTWRALIHLRRLTSGKNSRFFHPGRGPPHWRWLKCF